MKCLKALGLVAMAAMALTAFLGASSASATVICTTTTTPCGTSWHVDTIEASLAAGTSAVTRSTGGALEGTCSGSSLSGSKTVTGSATQTVVISVPKSGLIWSGCSQTTDTLAGGELEIHRITGTENGTITARGFEVTKVVAGVSCIYGTSTGHDIGVLTGGNDATMDLHGTWTKRGGSFLCPSTSIFEADYTITNHNAVYVELE